MQGGTEMRVDGLSHLGAAAYRVKLNEAKTSQI
jgi:hypothetical protein